MRAITDIQCFVLDMDGTIYLGNEIIDGAIEFINTIKSTGREYIFLTNNSSKNRQVYKEKLNGLGVDVEEEKIFTSGEATTIYLNSLKPNSKIFLLGTNYLEEEFINAGFNITDKYEDDIDFVVLGFDTTLTYNKLWIACDLIRDGITYIATHPDKNCPLEGGKFMPDTGSIIELIYASTGKRPYVIGKPNPEIIDLICMKYDVSKESIAMVGDRLYTDIQTGKNASISSVLVLSGETNLEEYYNSNIKADYVYESVKEINEELLK